MKKTIYRVSLFDGANDLSKTIVSMAAQSNGGKEIALADLKTVVDGQKLMYPVLYGDLTAELIGGNLLHIDAKKDDGYKTVCVIEQVELWEMKEPSPYEMIGEEAIDQ